MTQQGSRPPTIVLFPVDGADGGTSETGSTRGSSTQTKATPTKAAWVSSCHLRKQVATGRRSGLPHGSPSPLGSRGHSTQEVEAGWSLAWAQRACCGYTRLSLPGTMGSPSS